MNADDRIAQWMADLARALEDAGILVARGRGRFDSDLAVSLAFEALSNRVGDLSKKLVSADPARFSDSIWSNAARNRDFVVHQYHRVDRNALWVTVSRDFPALARLLVELTH